LKHEVDRIGCSLKKKEKRKSSFSLNRHQLHNPSEGQEIRSSAAKGKKKSGCNSKPKKCRDRYGEGKFGIGVEGVARVRSGARLHLLRRIDAGRGGARKDGGGEGGGLEKWTSVAVEEEKRT